MASIEVIILTHKERGAPHLESLRRSNPLVKVHIACEDNGWRNCDRTLRNWWSRNSTLVKSDYVCVMEWDCLVEVPLPEPVGDVMVANIVNWASWTWWSEIDRLEGIRPFGFTPFGCFMLKRECLDTLAMPIRDWVYDKDIISELRTPSLLFSAGYKITPHLAFKYCTWAAYTPPKEPGIYHPVKKPRN